MIKLPKKYKGMEKKQLKIELLKTLQNLDGSNFLLQETKDLLDEERKRTITKENIIRSKDHRRKEDRKEICEQKKKIQSMEGHIKELQEQPEQTNLVNIVIPSEEEILQRNKTIETLTVENKLRQEDQRSAIVHIEKINAEHTKIVNVLTTEKEQMYQSNLGLQAEITGYQRIVSDRDDTIYLMHGTISNLNNQLAMKEPSTGSNPGYDGDDIYHRPPSTFSIVMWIVFTLFAICLLFV